MKPKPYLQGPMTAPEARELTERYKKKGYKSELSIAPLEPKLCIVVTMLPQQQESRGRNSKIFKQRVWSGV